MSLSDTTSAPAELRLPAKVTVSLRAGFVLALANIICVLIIASAWKHVKSEAKTISVTGSAKRAIVSDLIVWNATVSASDPSLPSAFQILKHGTDRALEYLKSQNISEKAVTLSSISTTRTYKKDEHGHDTDQISSYQLSQKITVTGTDVTHIADVARSVTALIQEGVLLESDSPTYIYTKMADLKVQMLADATKDATTRAQQIATNSNATLGKIVDARMGVMQINPIHGDEASGSGVNDTTSYEKEITAVVSARFALD